MVRIEKSTQDGGLIRGSGYLVSLQNKIFVRTASHVTLGNLAGVKIFDCHENIVFFEKNKFITNNMLDDELIELENSHLPVLGVYSPAAKLFIVTKSSYSDYLRNKRRVHIEIPSYSQNKLISEDGFISLPWVKRTNFNFQKKERNSFLISAGNNPEQKPFESSQSQLSDFMVADVSVVPGESGSPVLGWVPYASLEEDDFKFHMQMISLVRGGLVDDQAHLIDAVIDPIYGTFAYIKGHVLAYHRSLLLSKFLLAETFPELNSKYFKTPGQDVSQTSWSFVNGNEIRHFHSEKLDVTEINDTNTKSGDGTSGHGGDGTSGHGGDGTSGHGGDGNSAHAEINLPVGIPYNNEVAISFKLINSKNLKLGHYSNLQVYFDAETYLVANWYNFTVLNSIQKMNPFKVYEVVNNKADLFNFLSTRFNSTQFNSAKSCQILSPPLKDQKLWIDIRLGAVEGDEIDRYRVSLDSFKALTTLKSKQFGMIDIDFSGILGIDLSFIRKQWLPENNIRPSILIRQRGFAVERYECTLH
jgi:hypothetical protein